jgi:hypothetical protein
MREGALHRWRVVGKAPEEAGRPPLGACRVRCPRDPREAGVGPFRNCAQDGTAIPLETFAKRVRRATGVRPLGRQKALTGEELEPLLETRRLLFLSDTGCRLGEGIGLERGDLDFPVASLGLSGGWITWGRVAPTKTHLERLVELTTRLSETQPGMRRPTEGRSEGSPDDAVEDAIPKARGVQVLAALVLEHRGLLSRPDRPPHAPVS